NAGLDLGNIIPGLQLDHHRFFCPICLDLLKDPAALPCGHSYCMGCIKKHWDEEDQGRIPSCPECRQSFIPKPVLRKNTILADLCVCYLCAMDEHRGHDIVSAAAERTKRQREIRPRRLTIHQLFRLVEKRSSEVQQQIISQQQTEVSRAKELQKKLQQVISELRRRDAELEQLSHTEDHVQFLLTYASLSALSESTHSASINVRIHTCFREVTAAVSELTEKLQILLNQDHTQISAGLAQHGTRAELLPDFQLLSVDPNTASMGLRVSEGNRKVKFVGKKQSHPHHPDRFTDSFQALSSETLTTRSYWEVKWSGAVSVALAYRNMSRTGSDSSFGDNDKSWALCCDGNGYKVRHDGASTVLSGPHSSTVGVHLDRSAGVLSFYSISDTIILLHRVQTTFTEPLHAGLCLDPGDEAGITFRLRLN
uniref:Uncharacterized protein n=1 Tax=Amphilophus citrinellus TaxID=61819 RepID=A0A3Q0RE72_AMPCI